MFVSLMVLQLELMETYVYKGMAVNTCVHNLSVSAWDWPLWAGIGRDSQEL